MAKIVFDLMSKKYYESISLKDFQHFLRKDPGYQNLFDFLSVDAEMNRNKIKVKQNYGNLMNTIKELQQDIFLLEGILFPEKVNCESNITNLWGSRTFTAQFQNVIHAQGKENPIFLEKPEVQNVLKSPRNILTPNTNSFIDNSIDNKNGFSNYVKKIKDQKSNDFRRNKSILLNLIESMKKRSKKAEKFLTKELNNIMKEEKFNLTLKENFNNESCDNNKHVVFLNNPNWNIVTSMVTGIAKSINIISTDKYHLLSSLDFK